MDNVSMDENKHEEELKKAAEDSGRRAALDTLTLLGVNVQDTQEVQKDMLFLRQRRIELEDPEVKKDLQWVRQARVGSEQTKSMVKKGFLTTIAGGICYLLWFGFKAIIDKH